MANEKSFDQSQIDVAFDMDADFEPFTTDSLFIDVPMGKKIRYIHFFYHCTLNPITLTK